MMWPTSPSSVAENSIVWVRPGAVAQDPLDLRRESVVGHAVGLVEDDDLDLGQRDVAGLEQVDQAQRRGDDDLDTLPQLLDLLRPAGAAVHGEDALAGRGRRPVRAPRRPARRARGSARGRARADGREQRCSTMRDSIGTPNASVLPEPVRARPHTSRPASATGIAAAWILNGWAKPAAARPTSMRSGTPSSAKPVGASTGGRAAIRVSGAVRWTDGRRGRRRRRAAPRRGVEGSGQPMEVRASDCQRAQRQS